MEMESPAPAAVFDGAEGHIERTRPAEQLRCDRQHRRAVHERIQYPVGKVFATLTELVSHIQALAEPCISRSVLLENANHFVSKRSGRPDADEARDQKKSFVFVIFDFPGGQRNRLDGIFDRSGHGDSDCHE
jgi:hypothetical protein